MGTKPSSENRCEGEQHEGKHRTEDSARINQQEAGEEMKVVAPQHPRTSGNVSLPAIPLSQKAGNSDKNLDFKQPQAAENSVVDDASASTYSGEEEDADENSRAVLLGQSSNNYSVLQQKWNHMFDRLVVFKNKHGHCLVPNRYSEDQALGAWVSTQRRQYKILTSGGSESTPMTVERATRLEDLGFVWATTDPRHVPWETRYAELEEFRKKNGNCLVPIGFKDNVKLANWVSTQRQEYKLLREGRSSRLTTQRIALLEGINFVWEAQRGGPRKRKTNKDGTEDNSEPPPKRRPRGTKPKPKKRVKARGPREAVVAGADFMGLAAQVVSLPSVQSQHSGIMQIQSGVFSNMGISGQATMMHQRQAPNMSQNCQHEMNQSQSRHQGMHLSQNQQSMVLSQQSFGATPSGSGGLASSYAQNAAAAAASAQQATAAANVAVAAAANFLRQAPPPCEGPHGGYNTSQFGGNTNATIEWHQRAFQRMTQDAIQNAAHQQNAMASSMKKEVEAHQAHMQAQTAQAHTMLQQQHAQATQRAAIAVRQQQQAAQALARFGVASSTGQMVSSLQSPNPHSPSSQNSNNNNNGPLNPFKTSTLPMSAAHAAAALNRQAVLAAVAAANGRRRVGNVNHDQFKAPDAATSVTKETLSALLPQLAIMKQQQKQQEAEKASTNVFNEEDAISINIAVPRNQAVTHALASSIGLGRGSTPMGGPLDTSAMASTNQALAPVVVSINDDAGIYDDAEDDMDFTVPLRQAAS